MRTNLSARICHRVDTIEDYLHLFPDGRDLDITAADRTMPQGVSIASVGDMRTPVSPETSRPPRTSPGASIRSLRQRPVSSST
ncbi:hypothetical protein ACFWWM_34310 [Streptomyces sp. NPDC058682]|uniref:hypothetical protein n=1 Tax=Streptomyces sp. NPDC058682 TaxID=3346596 RepID=UPI003646BD39